MERPPSFGSGASMMARRMGGFQVSRCVFLCLQAPAPGENKGGRDDGTSVPDSCLKAPLRIFWRSS
ncbi:hypothetical protein ANDA3_0120 [plant metagenome]|uniref:Uncharacterized protein n=2 Tax=root TaxID=1 RepID=A0A1C3K6L8_9BURK|nr:hypothetical protein ODI_03175 [Orrella dioscoreae]SOE52690.1 hypothetical protein ODI_R4408 [Orrella dioscoreae]